MGVGMINSKITAVEALEILDSRGNPTLQVSLSTDLIYFYQY